jgi:hypothetical protein
MRPSRRKSAQLLSIVENADTTRLYDPFEPLCDVDAVA